MPSSRRKRMRGVGGDLSVEVKSSKGKEKWVRRARLVPCEDGEHPLSFSFTFLCVRGFCFCHAGDLMYN